MTSLEEAPSRFEITLEVEADHAAETALLTLCKLVLRMAFEPRVQNSFDLLVTLEEGCDLIVTVGFLLGADTAIAAEANPDQKFAIIDFAYFDEDGNKIPYDNVVELNFATDQAAFLAGYVAAGTTQTGIVGTFGGIPIPPVTVFMDGFWYGVDYYNQENGTDVQVLGWDPATQEGLFTGNFEETAAVFDATENSVDTGTSPNGTLVFVVLVKVL